MLTAIRVLGAHMQGTKPTFIDRICQTDPLISFPMPSPISPSAAAERGKAALGQGPGLTYICTTRKLHADKLKCFHSIHSAIRVFGVHMALPRPQARP